MQRLMCWLSWFLLRDVRENLFHASVLASGRLLAVLGIPWLVKASLPSFLPSSSHGVFLVCVCVPICPFNTNTSHVGLGPTLLQNYLILTNYICYNPVPK